MDDATIVGEIQYFRPAGRPVSCIARHWCGPLTSNGFNVFVLFLAGNHDVDVQHGGGGEIYVAALSNGG